MPDIKKTRISVLPLLSLEISVATFLDPKTQEFVPMDISKKWITEKYAQSVFGDWCYPLKLAVAMCEQVVVEENVDKVIGLNSNVCKYPLVMGDMNKWIKKDFEYFPLTTNNLYPDTGFLQSFFSQVKKINPNLSRHEFITRTALAYKRLDLAKRLNKAYFSSLPLVKDARVLKTVYGKARLDLIIALTIEESERVVKEFEAYSKKSRMQKKPKHKILLTGDFATMMLEFPLFDLEVFLGKHGVEIINPTSPSNYYEQNYSSYAKKAREILSAEFSNKNIKNRAEDKHLIEIVTLYKLLKGVDEGIDGILYLKPIMCSPCDNVAYIIKKNNTFGKPLLEITYDEHSGTNGIVTRLEAFMNILEELNGKKK